MLISTEQRSVANQLNKMETFSKLRPPDAVRIKVKIIEKPLIPTNNNDYITSTESNQSSQINKNNSINIKQVKKFCVDPLITSFEILQNLISQAFGIKDEFQMSYLNRENATNLDNSQLSNNQKDQYLTIINDWDLDAAFLNSSQPYLSINVELLNQIKPNSSNLPTSKSSEQLKSIYDEWEVIDENNQNLKISPKKSPTNNMESKGNSIHKTKSYNVMNLDPKNRSLIALWSNTAADKAVSVFQRVLNGLSRSTSFNHSIQTQIPNQRSNSIPSTAIQLNSPVNIFDLSLIEQNLKLKQPLGDAEYRNFLDSDGRIVQLQELKQRIFEGGCDPSKRKELWPILLDIFPHQSMTSKQRNEFLKQKSNEYDQLKQRLWYSSNKTLHRNSSQILTDSSFDSSHHNSANDEIHLVSLAHKIHKDVWRTDRYHKFYAGDSNKNVESLFNILMTYSLSDECTNGYSQGMSDLLSPLYFVLKDEALAYLCFCSLIKRCIYNFDVLSYTMTAKIDLLKSLIKKYDSELWDYLTQVGADQLLFVYRWLLIECKREFPFNDCLRVLEVMWSTINTTNDFNPKTSAQYGRSNSNASSISLKLLKQLGNSNIDYLNEDFLISNDDDENFSDNLLETSSNSGKSRQNSNNNNNIVNNNNNNNNNNEHDSNCKICQTEKSLSNLKVKDEIESSSDESIDTDLESKYGYNKYAKRRQRLRRLSLNSSFLNNKTKKNHSKKFVPSSLNNNYYLSELKEQQYEDKLNQLNSNNNSNSNISKNLICFSNKSKKILNSKKSFKLHKSQHTGYSFLSKKKNQIQLKKSFSTTSCFSSLLLVDKKSSLITSKKFKSLNFDTLQASSSTSTSSINRKININKKKLNRLHYLLNKKLMGQSTSSTAMSSSLQNGRFSTSEAETITFANNVRNSLTKHSSTSSGLNEDMDMDLFDYKHSKTKKNVLKSKKIKPNQCSSPFTSDNELETNKNNLFTNIKKSLKRSHLRFNKFYNDKKDVDDNKYYLNSSPKANTDEANGCVSCSGNVTAAQNQKTQNEVIVYHKNSTSSKSSTSAYVSAASVASSASSISSTCSTPFVSKKSPMSKYQMKNLPIVSTSIPIVRVQPETPLMNEKLRDVEDDEEDLIYSLSKLDNPFLLFLCFALFVENRDHIISSQMDSNDIACFFDKMTRKHNMKNILNRAKYMYTKLYLSKANVFNYIQQLMDIQNSP